MMQNKRLSLIFSLILVLAILLSGCQPSEAETIDDVQGNQEEEPDKPESVKVGILLPLTGGDAVAGQNQKAGHEWAVEQINDAGGIECLGGAPIELVYGDSQGKPEAGSAETERLITNEGVIAVMGAYHTGVTLPATEIAERYEVPFIVPNAFAGSITERGLKYVFKTAVTIEQMAKDAVDFSKSMGAETVVVLTPNFTFGEEFAIAWETSVPEGGLESLAEIVYAAGASDYSDVVLLMKSADPDVILAVGDPADSILLVRQMEEYGYWPKMAMVTAGGGFGDPSVVPTLGSSADGLFLVDEWFPFINMPDAEQINNAFVEETGISSFSGSIQTSYATTWVLKEALEEACSTDPKALADTLRTTRFEDGKYSFMYPYVKFDETGHNETSTDVVAQYQNGDPVVVWPEEFAVGEAVWPVPAWDER